MVDCVCGKSPKKVVLTATLSRRKYYKIFCNCGLGTQALISEKKVVDAWDELVIAHKRIARKQKKEQNKVG